MDATHEQVRAVTQRVEALAAGLERLRGEVSRIIVGQDALLRKMLVGLLSDGHVLLEGVPGLAKTTAVATLAQTIDAQFKRIQFTPDLLPADILGTLVFQPRDGTFVVKRGPIFTNFLLADEINRAPAKVQSALLEAMQERHVTIGDESYSLDSPYLVLATQNPIEHEGTYPLPEAQLDRFMLKLRIDYPSADEEREILDRVAPQHATPGVSPVWSPTDVLAARTVADAVHIDARVKDYIVSLVRATRPHPSTTSDTSTWIAYGASPRATIYLARGARAVAMLDGRGYVTPNDVKDIAADVLRHRLVMTYEAEAEERTSDDLIAELLDRVPVP